MVIVKVQAAHDGAGAEQHASKGVSCFLKTSAECGWRHEIVYVTGLVLVVRNRVFREEIFKFTSLLPTSLPPRTIRRHTTPIPGVQPG